MQGREALVVRQQHGLPTLARQHRVVGAQRGVRRPEMVLPVTAHVAWFKAAEYFDVKVRLLPLDAQLHADVAQLERLVNRHTVMVLGSAP